MRRLLSVATISLLSACGSADATQDAPEAQAPAPWVPRYDYMADWNSACTFRDWPNKIRTITTPRRKAHLLVRESEEAFDWPAIFEELLIVNSAWTSNFPGWGFDWVTSNVDNYTKLLEGKYRDPVLARANERATQWHEPTETKPDAPAAT